MTAPVPGEQFCYSIPPGVKLAFFDLDETLTDRDTDLLWTLWRCRRHPKGLLELLWMLRLNARYYRGLLDAETYMAYHRFRVGGLGMDRLAALAERFFEQSGVNHISAGAPGLVRAYRERGVPTAVITAQQRFIAVPFARLLGVDEVIGNTFMTDDRGRFVRHNTPYCFREGKIPLAVACASRHGVALPACAFYSDSVNDVPLLERAGFPVAVDPDPLLFDAARERGWPVLYLRGENPSA